jgi:hypothetical protein
LAAGQSAREHNTLIQTLGPHPKSFQLLEWLCQCRQQAVSISRFEISYQKERQLNLNGYFAVIQGERWQGKSEHGDAWIFCLTAASMAANRRDHDEATSPPPRTGVQGEGGPWRHSKARRP